jgi:DNA-binding CsgD family transcriptional regulator
MTVVAAPEGPTAVARLVAAARHGDGGALVIRGGSASARSALLASARAAAGDVLDLRTSGVRAESRLRGAALHRLLRPLTPLVGTLPAPQAAELLRVLGRSTGRVDRLVLGTAVLDLLAAAERPVLCRVDAADLLDPVSLDALGFAGRRLGGSRVALLAAFSTDGLDGVPTLELPGAATPFLDLTPQQWQVARLVAAGATNREAAARLVLSPRTVEHHLRHIFARLGVRSRVELTRELLR